MLVLLDGQNLFGQDGSWRAAAAAAATSPQVAVLGIDHAGVLRSDDFVPFKPGTGAGAFLIRPWIVPTVHDAALLGLCGLIAGIGSTLIVFAYRTAGPGAIGTLEYTAMLWAILWGWVFFNNLPTPLTLAGAALIVASGIYALTRPAPEPHPRP